MWKAGVAAAAVGVAVFLAVVLAGRNVLDPEPRRAASDPVLARSWAERAGQLCRESTSAARAELGGSHGLETAEDTARRIYRETTRIQGALVKRLQALPNPPTEGAEAVEVLAAQHERDRETVQRLEQQLDAVLILTEVAAYERVATQLRTRFDKLGATGCVLYLDPASYE